MIGGPDRCWDPLGAHAAEMADDFGRKVFARHGRDRRTALIGMVSPVVPLEPIPAHGPSRPL